MRLQAIAAEHNIVVAIHERPNDDVELLQSRPARQLLQSQPLSAEGAEALFDIERGVREPEGSDREQQTAAILNNIDRSIGSQSN